MSKTEQQFIGTKVRSSALNEYLNAVEAIANEAKINLSPEGFRTEAVDPANVAMVRAELDDTAFLDAPDTDVVIGVNVRRLEAIAPSQGAAELTYECDRRALGVSARRYSYTHKTIDPDSLRKEPTLPDMDLSFRAEMDSEVLRDAVEWFDEFTDRVRMGYDTSEQRFWMEADERRGSSVGTDDGGFSLDRDDLEAVHESGKADSQFSLDYFKEIMSGVPEDRTVELYIGEEFPMTLSYDISHGEVQFMQAPRIQSD